MTFDPGRYSTFIFDLDGCVYFGDEPAPGATTLLHHLRQQGKRICILSNNSTHGPTGIRLRLAKMGIAVPEETIFTASTLAARHLFEHHGPQRVCVVGTDALAAEFRRFGHTVVDLTSTEPCGFLIMGRDVNFTFKRLERCVELVLNGATFIATNADMFHPTSSGGRTPETGTLAKAVASIANIHPTFTGKPEAYAFNAILKSAGVGPKQCLMIGDNRETDIAGALSVGMDACWIDLQQAGSDEPPGVYRFPSMETLCRAVTAIREDNENRVVAV